jgi:hypothetical protein
MSKATKNRGKEYTKADEKKIAELAKKNTPTGLIAYNLKRTKAGIQKKANDLGISLKPTNQKPYNRRKGK